MAQRYLVYDYETRSEADLKRVGMYEYAFHGSTEILCLAFRLGTREDLPNQPTKTWSPKFGGAIVDFMVALDDPTVVCVCHNSGFEQVITNHVLKKYVQRDVFVPASRYICTASLAAALALPRSLGQACAALKMSVQKDDEGRRLMLALCRPRKPTKNDSSKWRESTEDIKRLIEYCATDTDAEVGLFLRLPDLSEKERRVWLLDQEINGRGFFVDRPLVLKCLKMIETETALLDAEVAEITYGAPQSATQRDKVLAWLKNEDVYLDDLRKKTVEDAKEAQIGTAVARRMLEIRSAISKTSTAKYEAYESRSRTDGRVRDILLYHGASTGRWSGTGIQPQNFYKRTISQKLVESVIELINEEDE